MSRQTKATLVTTALRLVGNAATDLQSEAELWLDLILAEAAQSYRFPDLERQHSAAVAGGVSTLAFPSDYGFLVANGSQRGAVGVLVTNSGDRSPVYHRPLGELSLPAAASVNAIADDRYNSRWYYVLDDGGTLLLNYQCVPASAESTATVWYPNDLELVQQLKFLAEMYMRGNLLNVAAQVKEAARVLSLRSPSRLILFQGSPGADLDPRWFV